MQAKYFFTTSKPKTKAQDLDARELLLSIKTPYGVIRYPTHTLFSLIPVSTQR